VCTVLLRLARAGEWPVQLAFVRDEDRDRASDPPGTWWPDTAAGAIGGRDSRAGGTWLAVLPGPGDPAVALLTDVFDPAAAYPDPAGSPTRGTLPLLALRRGSGFDPRTDAPRGLERYQPFHLVLLHPAERDERRRFQRWTWDGRSLDHEHLAAGTHVVASRATTLPGESARRRRLAAAVASLDAPQVDAPATSDAWRDWVALLDSRDLPEDDLDHVAVAGVRQRPGFGTVGASLVAMDGSGALRYDANRTPTLDPAGWRVVTAPTRSRR
jgi:hypothetical protein